MQDAEPWTDCFRPNTAAAIPVHVAGDGLEAALGLPPEQAGWARRPGFAAGLGETCPLPDGQGSIDHAVLAGRGTAEARARKRFPSGRRLPRLPEGFTGFDAGQMPMAEREETALGFCSPAIASTATSDMPAPKARLVLPEGVDGRAP